MYSDIVLQLVLKMVSAWFFNSKQLLKYWMNEADTQEKKINGHFYFKWVCSCTMNNILERKVLAFTPSQSDVFDQQYLLSNLWNLINYSIKEVSRKNWDVSFRWAWLSFPKYFWIFAKSPKVLLSYLVSLDVLIIAEFQFKISIFIM